MTRRERLENKLLKRREWADKAETRSEQAHAKAHAATDGIPLGQPILVGHHSERRHRRAIERSQNAMTKACEESALAKHHVSKAGGLAHQLEKTIFSDDDDALEAIQAKIAKLEALQAQMKAVNAAHKAFLKNPASLDASMLPDSTKQLIRNYKAEYSWEPHPIAPYQLTNNSGNIRRLKERLKHVAAMAQRKQAAEAGGGIAIEGAEFVRITFAEKPDRSVLDALKEAGFRWGSGSWMGYREKIPQCVLDLAPNSAALWQA